MHRFNLNADDNSIDFDFFETDGNGSKLGLCDNKKKYSSKIITKAVIEAKPKEIIENSASNSSKLNSSMFKRENMVQTKLSDCISSPTSSQEKRLFVDDNDVEDVTLFNCLAYNDDACDTQMFNMEDKYFSDNSLSDSTITTVTSDLTSVSRLSSMSDSSCGSDLSTDLPTVANCANSNLDTNDNLENDNENKDDIDVELTESPVTGEGDSNVSENHVHKELIIPENDYQKDVLDSQSPEINYSAQSNEENESDDSECDLLNAYVHSENMFEEETSKENLELSQSSTPFRKESTSTVDLEERLGGISLASQSSSNSSMAKAHHCRGQNRFRSKRRELNLTFSREELIRIERDNTILLKKIMSYAKPRSVLLNHTFSHKKTSAAINRARQQKKIEQDNYILYSKINAMNRMKKVF